MFAMTWFSVGFSHGSDACLLMKRRDLQSFGRCSTVFPIEARTLQVVSQSRLDD